VSHCRPERTVLKTDASGPLASAWKFDGDSIVFEVTLPPNTAVVLVPTSDAASVRIDDKEPAQAVGVNALGGGKEALFDVRSGKWTFTAKRGGRGDGGFVTAET